MQPRLSRTDTLPPIRKANCSRAKGALAFVSPSTADPMLIPRPLTACNALKATKGDLVQAILDAQG